MSIVLKYQVEASEKSADEIDEQIRHDHRRAMLCYDVQDLSRSLVTLFQDINRDVERWQKEAAGREPQLCAELQKHAREWDQLYKRLSAIFEKVAGFIRAMETFGFQIEGRQQFLIAWRELRAIVCFSQDQVAAAVEQVRTGRVRTLGEVRDGLRNSPV